jgi:hypothetical protein
MPNTRPKIAIHDLATGENIIREMTDDELAQHEIDMANHAKEEADRVAKIAAREAILKKLGLTADEAALLLG